MDKVLRCKHPEIYSVDVVLLYNIVLLFLITQVPLIPMIINVVVEYLQVMADIGCGVIEHTDVISALFN